MLFTAKIQASDLSEPVAWNAAGSQDTNLNISIAATCCKSEQRISDEIAKLLCTFKTPRILPTTEAKTSIFISDGRPLPPPVRFVKKYKAI